jgi:HK97 family phage portal protein
VLARRMFAAREARANPGMPFGDSTPPSNSQLGGTVAGTSVTERTALQIAAVYGSVSVISDSVSSLPIDLMTTPHRRTGKLLAPSQLVTHPYIEISTQDWWVQFCMSLALRGNFYGHIIERDANQYPTQIKPVHPDNANVRRLASGNGAGAIEYRFYGRRVPVDDVFHVRFLSVSEDLVGLNPIEYLRNLLGLSRAAELYGGAFFQNSARFDYSIEIPEELDPDATVEFARKVLAAHQGINQQHLPLILTGGAKVGQPISITPEDAQFLESRQFDASTISGQIFRVPPHMIGIVDRTTSWGTGIEQQESGFVRNTLIGYLSRGERMLSSVHPAGQFVKFDLSDRMRGDRLQRAQAHSLEIANGSLLPDEARAEEDRPPLPDGQGQVALAPINAQSLMELALQSIAAAQAAENPQPVPAAPSRNGGNPNG